MSFSGSAEGSDNEIQIGFPILPPDRSLRFALLRKWLHWCDNSHPCSKDHGKTLPTRLLYVGDLKDRDYDPDALKIVPSEQIDEGKYVALSHRWGELKDNEVPVHCTTPNNINERQSRFHIADLPLTFKDAVEVTRGLGVKYLWIDSLCISQGEGGDWEQESKKMEAVYTSAYCTIAATSAKDSYTGFLKRDISSDYVCVQDGSGRRVIVCTNMADFDKDVGQAQLNTRAWVMQERFLSCRTIHFGAKQMYCECGEGVDCENGTRLTCRKGTNKYFKLDPKFPTLLRSSGFTATLDFLQSLLEDYSKRSLSKSTDRAVALSGLAARIAEALNCTESYGIFDLYLYRNLLWQRSDLQSTMEQIKYKSRDVPSWSWMAYTRGIKFMNVDFGDLDLFMNLSFDEKDKQALITNVWEFQDCHLKEMEMAESEAARREILDSCETTRGWIIYNVGGMEDFPSQRGVVVGRTGSGEQSEYHMLIVRQRGENKSEYERVGIGMVQKGYVSRQQADVYVF